MGYAHFPRHSKWDCHGIHFHGTHGPRVEWGQTNRSEVVGRAVTSAPSAVAASSYAAWPGPCRFVMPFNVLVVTQAMLLLLDFLTVSDRV